MGSLCNANMALYAVQPTEFMVRMWSKYSSAGAFPDTGSLWLHKERCQLHTSANFQKLRPTTTHHECLLEQVHRLFISRAPDSCRMATSRAELLLDITLCTSNHPLPRCKRLSAATQDNPLHRCDHRLWGAL